MLASHPPAPFRVKSLYATALELKLPHLPEKEIIEEIIWKKKKSFPS